MDVQERMRRELLLESRNAIIYSMWGREHRRPIDGANSGCYCGRCRRELASVADTCQCYYNETRLECLKTLRTYASSVGMTDEVEEYIREFEHQEGRRAWEDFFRTVRISREDLILDFRLYVSNGISPDEEWDDYKSRVLATPARGV